MASLTDILYQQNTEGPIRKSDVQNFSSWHNPQQGMDSFDQKYSESSSIVNYYYKFKTHAFYFSKV